GEWFLSWGDPRYRRDAAGNPTPATVSKTLASEVGVTPSYSRIPLRDATVTAGTASACAPATYSPNGPKVSWSFDQANPAMRELWDYRYMDGRKLYGIDETAPTNTSKNLPQGGLDSKNWVKIFFKAVPTASVMDCDPDDRSATPYLMQNNLRVSANTKFAGPTIVKDYAMAAPVDVPVSMEKTPDNESAADGSTSSYTVRVTNNLSVPLTNYTIDDTLNISVPGGFTAPLSKGYTCGTAVFAGGTGGAEIACDTTSSPTTATMQYRFASIAPGETVTVTIPMTFVVGERNATVYTNNVSATVAEWNNVVLTDSGLIRVVTPTAPPLPAKTLQSGAEPAPVNFVNTDRISMAVAPWALHYDLLYVDTLPNGLAFVDYLAPTCAATCVTPVSQIQTLPPRSNPDGTTTIAWWFGDTNGGPSGASYSLPYRVRNKDAFVSGAKVPTGTALVNQVQGFSNQVNTVPPGPMATIPDPSPWLWPSAIRTLVHTMRDPNLSITKTAVPSAVPTGAPNSITYDVKITNAAHPNSVTAFNVRVLDTPNSALESIVPAAPIWIPGSAVVASVVDGWTAADPEMEYFIPSILAGQSVTFRYTAQVKDSFAADGVFQAVNSARIAEVRSYSRLQPLPGDRVLTDLPPVSTTTPLAAPRIDIDKWNGVGCVAETAVASIGTPVDWCIRVRNTGSAPAPVVNLVDVLPANWSFQAGSTTGTGWTAGPPTATSTGGAETLSWSLGTLAVGATAMISYRATPLPGSELDVTNVATATAFQSPGVPYPPASPGMVDTDDAKATLRTHALEISKTPDRQIRPFVPGGGDVTWTITVTNPSAVSSLSNLEVRDFLPEPLTFVSATSTDPRVGAAVSGATGSGPSSTTEVTVPVSGLGAGESVAITLVGHFSGSASWVDTWLTNDTSVIAREVSDAVANTAKVRFFEPAALGNYVWTDSNANGIQDASESGRDGVVVSLRDNVGNPLYRNSITGEVSTVSGSGWVALSMATGDDPATPATETGWYGFGDLPGGDYQVLFTRGPATVWTFLGQGTSSTDSDVDPATGVVPVTLAPGQTDLRIDGGLVPAAAPASIGDRVWLDSNGDGIQGLAELGVSGVVVRLMGPGADGLFETADDQVLATDTTDVAGSYLFDLLPPGTYQIAVDLPSGNSFTWSGQGSNSELDSDVNRVSGRTEPAVLAAGENRTDLDAGLIPRGINALGDYVWLDANIDGIQEPTETGIENLIVSLLSAGPDGVFETADDLLLDVTRTDSTGSWTFGELPDGIYQAQFAPDLTEPAQVNLQPTWVRQGSVGAIDSDGSRTSGRSLPVDLDSSGTDSLAVVNNDVDSGFFSAALPASLGDVVWLDANRNGLLDSGESGIGGIIVRLVDAAGVVRAITTTASDGTYLFSRLPAGDYTVQFALDPLVSAHALLVPTWEHTGSDDAIDSDIDRDVLETPTVSLSPGENDRTVDAGFFSEPSAINSLGDRTWLDSNFDGIQSSGEPGLGGVLVELLIAGSDGVFGTSDDLAIQSARTDAGGDYRFTRLPDGDYQVRFSLDAGNSAHDGLAATWQGQGGDQSTDSNANRVTGRSGVITLGSSNREDLTVDAGYISVPDPAALGDYTWVDVDADGIQSSGDTALGGVVVDLLGPGPDGNFGTADDAVLQSVETDSAGAYLVDELPPGDYRVRFVAAGFVSTWSNQGTDSDLDSNLDRGTGLTETITLNAGERDLSIDAGFLNASDAVN
ncbi:MAG TPA: hypothetical protein DEG43_16690, partial [Acidimicrobiaceae bacterium]|nr:hypothetical protein [Acidimicrobiaceae bacterium]